MSRIRLSVFILVSIPTLGSLFQSCWVYKVAQKPIPADSISYVLVRDRHSIKAPGVRSRILSLEQARTFAEKWNKAKPLGPCKFITRGWVEITFNDSSKRSFCISSRVLSESNDYGYRVKDTAFLGSLTKGL